MKDPNIFQKAQQICLDAASSLLQTDFNTFLISKIKHAKNISDLLFDLKAWPDETLQSIYHNLIINHLEFLMCRQANDLACREITLLDWNRTQGCQWRVNNNLYYPTGSIMQYQSLLQLYGITNLTLRTLINRFAGQACWLDPMKIIKIAYIKQGLLLVNDKQPSEIPKELWDSVDIFSLEENKLGVSIVNRFFKLINSSTGDLSFLNEPASIAINFEIFMPIDACPIVSNFAIHVKDPTNTLKYPTTGLANYFIMQEQEPEQTIVHSPRAQTPSTNWTSPPLARPNLHTSLQTPQRQVAMFSTPSPVSPFFTPATSPQSLRRPDPIRPSRDARGLKFSES